MLFNEMTASHKASVINQNNTAGKQHRCSNPLIQYDKYQISTFLFEPLAKKVCSVSFVSQYRYFYVRLSVFTMMHKLS